MVTIQTFDLQARAELAARSLTALLDAERDGQLYFLADWGARPPRADHGLWDCGDGTGRQMDALVLARAMVRQGSPAATPTCGDAQLEGWMLRYLGESGLSWLPAEPWAAPWGKELLMASWQPGQPAAEISWAQRGTLMGLLSRFLATADEQYAEHARRQIDGLLGIAVRDSDGLFFPEGYYQPSGWQRSETGLFAGIEEYNSIVALPAVRWFEVTGYEPALELADGLVRFALRHTRGYRPDGSFSTDEKSLVQVVHFHTRTSFAQAVLKLGLALGRREYVAWARQSYEEAKTWGTSFGLFPEHLGDGHGEICGTVDMIELALLLGQHVDPAYYADAECFGRNQLLESQFLSLERLEDALTRVPAGDDPAPYDGRYSSWDGVAESQVGAFACRSTLNDAFHRDALGMMQCCNAAGTRGLYDLWRYAVQQDGHRQSVHLRFSVETPALRVVSHEPARGQLDIVAKQACEVQVRLPKGTQQALAVFAAGGDQRVQELPVCGSYVSLDAGEGESVTLYYPLVERTETCEIGLAQRRWHCTARWRGETVMSAEPRGCYYPLYDRSPDLEPVLPSLPAGSLMESL